MIVRLELNSSENGILCSEDTTATCKLSGISLECDAIFDESYVAAKGELYAGTMSIPHNTLTSIDYQTLYKEALTGGLT